MSHTSNSLTLVCWTWQWFCCTQRKPLWCGGRGDLHHGFKATVWYNHVNMEENLWEMLPTPCLIYPIMHFWRGRGVYLIEECIILVSIHRVKKKSPDFCSNWLAVVYIGDKNGQVVASLKSQTCLIHSNHGQHNFSVMIHEQSCHYLFSELTAFVFACSGATVMLAAVIFWV